MFYCIQDAEDGGMIVVPEPYILKGLLTNCIPQKILTVHFEIFLI